MDWEKRLCKYAGNRMKVWIEDRSGEEQTKPKDYILFKVKKTVNEPYIQFYLNERQFLSVPIFDHSRTKIESDGTEVYFVSHDEEAKLLYWVYFM